MINQSVAGLNGRLNEQTGQFVRCPVCDQLLDLRDLDEILLHAHDMKFECDRGRGAGRRLLIQAGGGTRVAQDGERVFTIFLRQSGEAR